MELPLVDFQNNLPITDTMYQALKQAIINSQIKPREHLIIGELADHYGISRTPVREAINLLEKDGWLAREGRRGAQVLLPSKENLMQIVETQAALEAYAVSELARRGVPAECLLQVEAVLDAAEEAIEKQDNPKAEYYNSRFSELIYEQLGNEFLRKTVLELEEKVVRVRSLQFQHGNAPTVESLKQHRGILQAIRQGDSEQAYQQMFHHTVWFEDELLRMLQSY